MQRLGLQWFTEKVFPNFRAFRRHVNKLIDEGEEISQVSMFYDARDGGCMEIFAAGRSLVPLEPHLPVAAGHPARSMLPL